MDGVLQPRRVRAFSDVIKSHFGLETTFGATALSFSADGTKLIIGLSQSGLVAVVHLHSATDPRVLRVFDHHRQIDARTRLRQGMKSRRDATDIDSNISSTETGLDAVIVHLATSYDGQWLASTDLRGCTHVFNLDSIQVQVIWHQCRQPNSLPYSSTTALYQLYLFPYRQYPSIRTFLSYFFLHFPTIPFGCSMSKKNSSPNGLDPSHSLLHNASHSLMTQ